MITFMDLNYTADEDTAGFDPHSFKEQLRSPKAQTQAALDLYSNHLIDVVQRCCRYKPAERHTASQLREVVRAHIADEDNNVATIHDIVKHLWEGVSTDPYAVGVRRSELG